jgi:hypothetical protein
MNCNYKEKNKFKKYLLRILGFISVIVFISLCIGAIGWYYRYHIYWKYVEYQYNLQNVKKIPDKPMPEMNIPKNWEKYSWEYMSFYLPPGASLIDKIKDTVVYNIKNTEHGEIKLILTLHSVTPDFFKSLDLPSQPRPPNNEFWTSPQLRLKIFSAEANDFRWSMTPNDVRWHILAIYERSGFNAIQTKNTESILKSDLVCDLNFCENFIWLNWQCPSCSKGGYINFYTQNKEQGVVLNIIRLISQSIKVNCKH